MTDAPTDLVFNPFNPPRPGRRPRERRRRGWVRPVLLTLGIAAGLTGVTVGVVKAVVAVKRSVERSVAGFGSALAGAMAQGMAGDQSAAAALAVTPAPPPVAGTAEQAGELGAAMSNALTADDRAAAEALLDHASLLRGLLPPATADELDRAFFDDAGAAGPPVALSEDFAPTPGLFSIAGLHASLLTGLWDAARPPAAVNYEGVREVDGAPAAAFAVTPDPAAAPSGTDGTPDAGPLLGSRPFTVLLIPGTDGRVAAVVLEFDAAVAPDLPATGPVRLDAADLLRSGLLAWAAAPPQTAPVPPALGT